MKFNYFFNSLYLLTNKTQMKMKKTFSLKLMLLGLLIGFGSMTAFAGDFFTNGGFVFEKVPGGVKVAGVTKLSTTGVLTIGTNYKDSQDPDDENGYNVVAIADNWYNPGKLIWIDSDGTRHEANGIDLRDKTFVLKIDAKELTSINTAALQPLNGSITQFIVTTDAGLKGVPAYAFANVPMMTVDNKDSQEYKELKEYIDGIKALQDENVEDYTIPVFKNGVITLDGAYKDKRVYKMEYNLDGTTPVDGTIYVVLSDVAGTTSGYNLLYKVNKSGSFTKTTVEAKLGTGANAENLMGKLSNWTKDKAIAKPLAETSEDYASWGAKKMKGLQTQFDEADAAWRNLVQERNNFLGVNEDQFTNEYQHAKYTYDEYKLQYDAQKAKDDALNLVYMTWKKGSQDLKDAIACPSKDNKDKLTEQEDIDDFEFIWNTLFTAGYAQNDANPKGYTIEEYADVHQLTKDMRDQLYEYYDTWKSLIAYADNKTKAQYTNHNGELTPVKDDQGKQVKGMTLEQLEAAISAASTVRETLALALGAAEGADETDLTDLEEQLEGLATKQVPQTDPKKFLNNEVLTKVQIDNNKMEYFGDGAFVNCVGVATEDWTAGTSSFLFPATTATIGAYAFKGTHINAKLGSCATTLQKIGDYAFQDTETQYVNLKNATQLTDIDENGKPLKGDKIMIGKGVWNNTPLISIALNNTGLTNMPDGLAEKIRREKTLVDGCEAEGFYVQANTTLTSVGLPVGLKKIAKNQFIWCLNLGYNNETGTNATLTVPGTVTYIGEAAFRGTAYKKFNLTALTELDYVGDLAFANNSALESVLFAAEAPFEDLKGSTFQCDNNLNEVVINDDLECLPAGIFEGTSLKKLDLSNSKITVLNNLFKAGDTAETANTTLTSIKLPSEQLDDDNFTVLRPGLKVIADNALSHLWNLKEVDIPSSVELMGSYVFQDDQALETVTILNSKMNKLGEGTFNSTPNLKTVKFLTLTCIDKTDAALGTIPTVDDANYCGGDVADLIDADKHFGFVEGVVFGSASRNENPEVWVTLESYEQLIPDDGANQRPGYQQLYTTLVIDKPSIKVVGPYNINGSTPIYAATYFNADFGTWIPTAKEKQNGAEVHVWTAYQDGNFIYAYSAKHNNDMYKIPAAGKPDYSEFAPARMMEGDDNDDDDSFDDNLNPAPTGGDTDEDVNIPVIGGGSSAYYERPLEPGMAEFAAQTTKGTYVFDAIQKYQPGSAAVIITSDKADPVNYEQRSTSYYKYQSTLDWKNELKVTAWPITTTTDDDVYKFTHNASDWYFGQDVREIPAKKVVFEMSPYQGTAYPDLSRVDIVFLEGEFTDIDDVKQYVQKMKESGDIYDMRGIKVSTPVKGQLYIQNGKKFIQK